jgi:MFS family permease
MSPDAADNDANPSILAPAFLATTIGMVALVGLIGFEALAVATAMPTVAKALDGLRLYALAFGLTIATSTIGMTLAGPWGDARGPAPPLWTGLGCFVCGLLMAGCATTMPMLLAGRLVQGLGAGGIYVALYVLAGERYPAATRPRLFAAFSAAWVVPSLVGPAVSGAIVEHLGWRWVFLGVPALALPAALALVPALRGTRPRTGRFADGSHRVPWACGAAIGICLLYLGGQLHGIIALAVLLPATALTLVSTHRLLPRGTLRAARGLPSVIALRGLVCAAFFGAEAFLPLLLSRERGLSPTQAGLALTAGALGWSAASWYQGHRRNGWSRHRFLRVGTACVCAGLALSASALLPGVPVAMAVLGWVVAGLGMGLISASLAVLTLAMSPADRQGEHSSALQLSEATMVATTLAIGGSLFSLLLGHSTLAAYGVVFAIAGVMAVLAALVVARTGARAYVVN